MNFSDPSKIFEVIKNMRDADQGRSTNRARINSLFNGDPPYTEAEAAELKVQTNVNFLEASRIGHDARRQFNNAFLSTGNFFTVRLDRGPIHKKSQWGSIITKNLNKILKKHLPYIECIRATGANVVLHGIAPSVWQKKGKWCPTPLAIDDLLVPGRTTLGFGEMDHFAIRTRWTKHQLNEMTSGPKTDPGWKMGVVKEMLSLLEKNQGDQDMPDETPEKVAEEIKANSGFYNSDAAPSIVVWDFYYRSDEENWDRKILMDRSKDSKDETKIVFKKDGYAEELGHILHCQFGDCSNVAPFRYHTVRSIGYMLYSVVHLSNRIRCKFSDSVFEAMLSLFRNVPAEDREKIEMILLNHMGIIPQGVDYVPANERYTVDSNLVNAKISQLRQIMSENSASYTRDSNDGTNKELTATEVMQRAQSASALVNAMLAESYTYAGFQHQEIARRFCEKESRDKDVKDFRNDCRRDGVPEEMLHSDCWEVTPERAMANGNKIMQIAQAQKLMEILPQLDPDAQRKVVHMYIEANCDDPLMAEDLTPLKGPKLSDATQMATLSIGTLMLGLPVPLAQGINHIDYVETIIGMMTIIVQRLEKSGGMASEEQIVGLANTYQHALQHIQIVGQDKNEAELVKKWVDALSKIMSLVQAYAQRLQEQQQSQGGQGMDPELMGKLQSMVITEKSTAKIKEAQAAQKFQHNDAKFQAQQLREDAKLRADIAAKDLSTQAEVIRKNRVAEQTPKPAAK